MAKYIVSTKGQPNDNVHDDVDQAKEYYLEKLKSHPNNDLVIEMYTDEPRAPMKGLIYDSDDSVWVEVALPLW